MFAQTNINDVCTLPRMTKVLPEAMRLALQLEGWCAPHVDVNGATGSNYLHGASPVSYTHLTLPTILRV